MCEHKVFLVTATLKAARSWREGDKYTHRHMCIVIYVCVYYMCVYTRTYMCIHTYTHNVCVQVSCKAVLQSSIPKAFNP